MRRVKQSLWIALMLATSPCVNAGTFYVSPSGSNNPPYDTWDNAATDIVAAVGMADNGDSVIVSNGIYILTSTIYVFRQITLRSVNGPAVTVIDGNNSYTCIYMENRYSGPPLIDGFTITRGNGVVDGMGGYGGGITIIYSGGIIRNCIVTSNYTDNGGGGFFCYQGGNIENCLIRGNTAADGGGVYYLGGGWIRNSVITDNVASNRGGGINSDRDWADIYNCTIAYNSAAQGGGLSSSGAVVKNSIMLYNSALAGSNYDVSGGHGGIDFSCSAPIPSGTGNLADDPVFLSASEGDFRLTASSPCIDAGTNEDWMLASRDFNGQARVFNNQVDIGADEAVLEASFMTCGDISTSLWNVVLGATCQLQKASILAGNAWSNALNVVTAADTTISFALTNDADAVSFQRLNWIR